jgi:SHS2 domain-containing protein
MSAIGKSVNNGLNAKMAYISSPAHHYPRECLILNKWFEFLEHTADLYIAAHGKSLEEAFENAAAAMFEGMTELDKIKPRLEDKVEVEGYDKQALLYNWLEALLLKFETENKLYSRFKIAYIEETSKGLKLTARIKGELFDSNRHLSKVGVKAVTYHQMEILENGEEGVTVKFILDI